jgi:hypothetical protein
MPLTRYEEAVAHKIKLMEIMIEKADDLIFRMTHKIDATKARLAYSNSVDNYKNFMEVVKHDRTLR